jgi:phage tail-like protein
MTNVIGIRYALVRDRAEWEATRTGLERDRSDALVLACVPGPAAALGVAQVGPYTPAPSGIASDSCGRVYLCDTANNRVVVYDEVCGTIVIVAGELGGGTGPGNFQTPAALSIEDDALIVTDSGNRRIQELQPVTLDVRAIWSDGLVKPTGLARSRQGLYVLDQGVDRIVHFDALRQRDDAFSQSPAGNTAGCRFIAVGGADSLFASVAGNQNVSVFGSDGAARAGLATPAPFAPGALAADGTRLFAANTLDGTIAMFDVATMSFVGLVPNYRGPVSAMSIDRAGNLYVKSGADEAYSKLAAASAHVATGSLDVGPLDAGEGTSWLRLRVEAETPPGTTLALYSALRTDTGPPVAADYHLAPSRDLLLADPRGTTGLPLRYLWVRICLSTTDPSITPRLRQVTAQTPGRSYIDDLPTIYRAQDAGSGFLRRWLELFRAKIEDVEHSFEDVADRFDPRMAPASEVGALATWVAFDGPPSPPTAKLRDWLSGAWRAYARRGTVAGLQDAFELYTGVRPEIVEAFRERHLWRLGENELGFGTGLAPALPDGMAVQGPIPGNPSLAGLTGDYFSDVGLSVPSGTQIDPQIVTSLPARSSARWTGQVLARYSEIYALDVMAPDGVRLWIDDGLVIDRWIVSSTAAPGYVRLQANHWHRITLEVFVINAGPPPITLLWSSTSQGKEIIPPQQLYAVVDDSVTTSTRDPLAPPPDLTIVGETVVGGHGPLDPSQFGQPLFWDSAHRFTVLVPAHCAPDAESRQTLVDLVEREKPAHTVAHVCFVVPGFVVGVQDEVGQNAVIGEIPAELELGATRLGYSSTIPDEGRSVPGFRIGQRDRIARDNKLG